MLETNFTIRFIRIVSSHIEIARKLPKTFELQIECKAKIKTPKNAEEKKAALFFVLKYRDARKGRYQNKSGSRYSPGIFPGSRGL